MSDQPSLPTEDDLKKLPLLAMVAYAVRCARRVQPMLDTIPSFATHGAAVEQAISLAERFCVGKDLNAAPDAAGRVSRAVAADRCAAVSAAVSAAARAAARADYNRLLSLNLGTYPDPGASCVALASGKPSRSAGGQRAGGGSSHLPHLPQICRSGLLDDSHRQGPQRQADPVPRWRPLDRTPGARDVFAPKLTLPRSLTDVSEPARHLAGAGSMGLDAERRRGDYRPGAVPEGTGKVRLEHWQQLAATHRASRRS